MQKQNHRAIWALCSILVFILFAVIALEPRPGATLVHRAVEVTPTPWTLTLANYQRLQTGITYDEACEILGKSGTETARSELAGYVTVMYSWQGDGPANMNAMFQNGKLVSKAQFGLQ